MAASVALPVTANAATAPATVERTVDGRILYKAAAGQINKVGIKASSANGVDVTKISCTRSGASGGSSYAVLGVSLGDGNDSITYDNATGQAANSALLMLGSGNDKAVDTGSVDGNEIDGEAGDDTITVGTDAIVFGDDGNDTVHLGARSDAYTFTGNDTVYADGADSSVYAGRATTPSTAARAGSR